jgi:hypothetical protein
MYLEEQKEQNLPPRNIPMFLLFIYTLTHVRKRINLNSFAALTREFNSYVWQMQTAENNEIA